MVITDYILICFFFSHVIDGWQSSVYNIVALITCFAFQMQSLEFFCINMKFLLVDSVSVIFHNRRPKIRRESRTQEICFCGKMNGI
jgi:hypothetical protein